MIATISAVAEKKVQRSPRSQRQQKYQDVLRMLTPLKMAANTKIEKTIRLGTFYGGSTKIRLSLQQIFKGIYRDKYKKINCWKAIGEKFD